MGVMLAGAAEAAPRAVHAAVAGWGGGSAWTATGERLAAPWAALINGTAAHAQDYDDVLSPAMSHPSAALVPAILALAEETQATGAACIDAYLAGFEIMARLGEAMNLAHYRRGWHTTLSIGATGVAAACARLLRLDGHAAQMALSLSTSMAGGSKQQFGSMAKPLHAGLAAKNGMVAARLAACGMQAIAEAFEGPWGYVMQTTGPDAPGFETALEHLGAPSAMQQHGLWLKLYPCCASAHRPVDALRALAEGTGFTAADVIRIDAHVSEVAAANLRYRDPATPSEARFSLTYCLAAALADDVLTGASFTPAALQREAVRAVLPRAHMHADPQLTHVDGAGEGAWVEVRLHDGQMLERRVDVPHGHPQDPLSEAELEAKFHFCADGTLSKDHERRVLDVLRRLECVSNIRELTALLAH